MQIVMLIVFIAASVAQDETINVTDANAVTTARAAAGWVIFVGVIAFIYESLFIVIRFLNFTFMTTYRQICLIIVSLCLLVLFFILLSLSLFP